MASWLQRYLGGETEVCELYERTHLETKPLADVEGIIAQHKKMGLPLSEALHEKLQNPNCQFVVTGQQPGIGGGPLYVWYKAITALAQAKLLEKERNHPVVPLFWIAGDDSDLSECNLVETPQAIRLSFENAEKLYAVGSRFLTKEHRNILQKALPHLAEAKSYEEGQDIAEAFAKTLYANLPEASEFLFVRADSDWVRKNSQKTLQGFVEKAPEVEKILQERIEHLKELGLSTVEHREGTTRVFELQEGLRQRVFQGVQPSKDLSHDVLSRPIVCDTLFPVVAHVLGPGEFAYFSLLKPLYSLFKVPFPQVIPRMKATIWKEEQQKQIASLDLSIPQFLKHKPSFWYTKWMKSQIEVPFAWNEEWLTEHDKEPHLLQILESLNQKWGKRKAYQASKTQYSSVVEELDLFFGQGRPQERVRPYALFSKKELDELYKLLNPLSTEMQWIQID